MPEIEAIAAYLNENGVTAIFMGECVVYQTYGVFVKTDTVFFFMTKP